MKHCKNCGTRLHDESIFCPKCGYKRFFNGHFVFDDIGSRLKMSALRSMQFWKIFSIVLCCLSILFFIIASIAVFPTYLILIIPIILISRLSLRAIHFNLMKDYALGEIYDSLCTVQDDKVDKKIKETIAKEAIEEIAEETVEEDALESTNEDVIKMHMVSVSSSLLDSVGYNENLKILLIRFVDGVMCEYYDVPKNIYMELITAPSAGAYFHKYIDGFYRYSKKFKLRQS